MGIKEGLVLKLARLIKYYIRKVFMENLRWKCAPVIIFKVNESRYKQCGVTHTFLLKKNILKIY